MTLEPLPSPRSVNEHDEQMIFQDEFIQSIKEKDMRQLPRMLKIAYKRYAEVMEPLICWAELIIK